MAKDVKWHEWHDAYPNLNDNGHSLTYQRALIWV